MVRLGKAVDGRAKAFTHVFDAPAPPTTTGDKSMASLRLASFRVNGRVSYGAVTDGGIVDLGRKLSKYPTLLDVFRSNAIADARTATTGWAGSVCGAACPGTGACVGSVGFTARSP